jgi:hypothetical protein
MPKIAPVQKQKQAKPRPMLLTMIKMMLSSSHMRRISVNAKGWVKGNRKSGHDGVKESRQINWSVVMVGCKAEGTP